MFKFLLLSMHKEALPHINGKCLKTLQILISNGNLRHMNSSFSIKALMIDKPKRLDDYCTNYSTNV